MKLLLCWLWDDYKRLDKNYVADKVLIYFEVLPQHLWARVAQYSDWLQTGWPEFDPQQRQKDFPSSLCVQTGPEAHPASYAIGTGGPFLGVAGAWCWPLNPIWCQGQEWVGAIPLSPAWWVAGQFLYYWVKLVYKFGIREISWGNILAHYLL
jgi:hypothetical protein